MSRTRVLMIHPKFVAGSFWNYSTTCEMVGAKYPAPPLGLITIAAMLPQDWQVRLTDRNVGELRDEDLDWADLVMTGGMLPQQSDLLAIIDICKDRSLPVVVGGPDVTSSPEIYESADFRVIGEAEGMIPKFVDAWISGERCHTFRAEKFKADVTTTPIPRFDLLDFSNYVYVGVQYSRGCPFTCEFCDIIELYGRVPRTKTNDQILAELDRLYELGYRGHVDFVDDNLIGNKRAIKQFLPELIAWQKKHGYPFELSTEASLNLADDKALLEMMQEAGFFIVFVGIESPDPKVLIATRKKQNTRRDIVESINRIFEHGIFVIAGFIVGFDEESDQVADEIGRLIEETAIPVAMAGLLFALPSAQLTRRLAAEGRLHDTHKNIDPDIPWGDQCTAGLNFVTRRPRAQILRDYRSIIERVYAPDAYFQRVRAVGRRLDMRGANGAIFSAKFARDMKYLGSLIWSMATRKSDFKMQFWKTLAIAALTKPRSVKAVLTMMALYAHLGPYSRFVIAELDNQISAIEAGDWVEPQLVAAE